MESGSHAGLRVKRVLLAFGQAAVGLCGRGRPGGKPGSVPDPSPTGWWLERCAGTGGCTEHREQSGEGKN